MKTLDNRFSGWKGHALALAAGAITPLSLAPYNYWFLGLLAAGLLCWLLTELSAKQGFIRAFIYGLGLYLSGASWVYVSIHDFGFATTPLAIILTGLFVISLALVFAAPFYFFCRFFCANRFSIIFAFPALWVLGEWSRTWFLTGFPWLFIGYAHIDTWLSGWAPILGVLGVSYIAVLSGTLFALILHKNVQRITYLTAAALVIFSLWSAGKLLSNIEWGEKQETNRVSIALVQPNIPLPMKWSAKYQPFIAETLLSLTEEHWGKDIIVWPEAAIPYLYQEGQDFIQFVNSQAESTNTALLSGVLYDRYDEQEKQYYYYNAILGLGNSSEKYFKQRLVPFGEYVPFESYLRGLIAFFDLPNSVIHKGPKESAILDINKNSEDHYKISPSICYEIVYPDLVADSARQAEILVTISNDAWFGDSIGPLQHFQMAQMRALENNRYVIRSTNTGISGLIDNKGKIVFTGQQFARESISGEGYRLQGNTLFSNTGSLPIILFCLSSLILLCVYKRLHH